MSNPYRRVHRWTRRRAGGGWARLLPVLAAAIAAPWARRVLLGFLEQGRLDSGLADTAFRMSVLVAGAMSLHTYSDLIRGPDRPILDPHPVQARALLRALVLRTALERIYLPLICAVLLLPVGLQGHWTHFGGGLGLIFAGYWVGLGIGNATHLGAVWASRSPGLDKILDLLRGKNPRMQAALIYAPGFALGVAGVSLALASAGMESALKGWMPGWFWMGLPLTLGAVGLVITGPLADRYYVRTTAILGEIDNMYAGVDAVEDGSAVYLEWLAFGNSEVLRALRHGWRGLRIWPMGAWMMGLVLGVIALASELDEAVSQVKLVGSASVLLIVAVTLRMAARDPLWLDRDLGVSTWKVFRSRVAVALLYSQGVVIPAALGLFMGQGVGPEVMWALLYVEAVALTGAVLSSLIATEWRGRGIWAYGPLGIMLWAVGLGGQL